ncbi:efflux RND transporter permease subunit [Pelotalea chapellei]|uniref:Efflux RND transporter permease subunit n=1 Tax=Pelotalea chapellei TaxID=44671 RepID=A0ABS5UAK0_9BACT|nr:efflux RND transporter permease subunit [Pelotalea chapellei]MBT1072675.1 efflux RND transporter permease subunit [Pelotalea chapellei]
MTSLGLAGRIARAFIDSKLTPLIVGASLLLGLFSVLATPREEEPQIVVPMVDIYLPLPGSSPKEVEERLVAPYEKKIWELEGVEYVYSASRPGMGIVTVRFLVGSNMEESLVKLYNKVMSSRELLPPGSGEPLVVPKSIDDVPILTVTLWSERYDHHALRRVAQELLGELKKSDNVGETEIKGGLSRELKVRLDSGKLANAGISPVAVLGALQKGNQSGQAGTFASGNRDYTLYAGSFLDDPQGIKRLVVGVKGARPIYLEEVAQVIDGVQEPADYVFFGLGPAAAHKGLTGRPGDHPAVTLSVAKRKGANATWVAEDLLQRVEFQKGKIIPAEMQVTVTRNYGETAKEKNNELLFHMFLAAISVTLLIAIFMGWRAGAVAAIAIPVTLALTMFIFNRIGYTLNRITLFALIFSIGILVDDAIVVVENIHRYFTTTRLNPLEAAIRAVDEIGNPTILATFAVIGSILPMGFVGGLMGPYMRPIPVGASLAMIFSLLIAFIVTPYFAYRFMKGESHFGDAAAEPEESVVTRFYRRVMGILLHKKPVRNAFLALVVLMLLLSCSLVYFKAVTVKMLPFDNKSELQLIVDAPEGTTLEENARLVAELGDVLRKVPEVTDFQSYVGISSPFNFNGLVRHYYLRKGANIAEIQVNLVPKDARKEQSHDIARRIRPALKQITDRYGARLKVAEIPPGPPVLSTLVAEVYGPDQKSRVAIAQKVKQIFKKTEGVVDTDWYQEDDQPSLRLEVDREKAGLSGINAAEVVQTLQMAAGGAPAGLMHVPREKEPVLINLRLPEAARNDLSSLSSLYIPGPRGNVPLSQLVRVVNGVEEKSLYRKNMKSVVYVTGDVAGAIEAPVYAILKMQKEIDDIVLPGGYHIEQRAASQPWNEERPGIKWDGEWHITYEVFRDLGAAFAAVMVLIYVLVVAWFKDFTTPLVIMAPIPLTLIGILPGHALMGAFFTATSMIGFIALAGIIVRNSIILIDFAELRRREGMPLDQAIIDAGAVRFRPMLLTAAAVVVGSFVILFDPIFQGLALAMMCGEIASTTLSRITIPILYYLVESWKERHQKMAVAPGEP